MANSRQPLRAVQLAFFFRQLQTMTQAGLPLVQSLNLLGADLPLTRQRQALQQAIRFMEKGRSLSEVLTMTNLFPHLACQSIRAGEQSGALDVVFGILSAYYQQAHERRNQLVQALAYPCFLIGCTLCLCVGVVFGIVPVFADLFSQLGLPLPQGIQRLMVVVHWLQRHAGMLGLGAVGGGICGAYVWRQAPWRLRLSRYCLGIPWLRSLGLMICWQRCSQLLAIQLASGLPLLPALQDAAAAVPWQWFRQDLLGVMQALAQGASLSQAVLRQRISTPYVETMLVMGEQTGKYEEVLQAIHEYYQWRLTQGAKTLQQWLGPAVLLLVGAGIGFLLISLVMPLLDVASGMAG